jgi:hypothetical protein
MQVVPTGIQLSQAAAGDRKQATMFPIEVQIRCAAVAAAEQCRLGPAGHLPNDCVGADVASGALAWDGALQR